MFGISNILLRSSISNSESSRPPSPISVKNRLATIRRLENNEDWQAAKEEYEKLIEEIRSNSNDSDFIFIYCEYANCLSKLDNYQEKAKKAYEEAIVMAQINSFAQNSDISEKKEEFFIVEKYVDYLRSLGENGAKELISYKELLKKLTPPILISRFFTLQNAPLIEAAPSYSLVENCAELLDTRHLNWLFSQQLPPALKQTLAQVITQVSEQFSKTTEQSATIPLITLHEYISMGRGEDLELYANCIKGLSNALKPPLDSHLLDGLSAILLSRPYSAQNAKYYLPALSTLLPFLETITIQNNLPQVHALLRTVTILLDQMVSAEIDETQLSEIKDTLSKAFKRFEDAKKYPELIWPMAYARQALEYLPVDKSIFDEITKYLNPTVAGGLYLMGGVFKIIAASATPDSSARAIVIAGLEPDRFIAALREFWQVYNHVSSGSTKRQRWYTQLRELDGAIARGLATGQLDLVEKILFNTDEEAAYDEKFFLGLCDRFERMAHATKNAELQAGILKFLSTLEQGSVDGGPTWENQNQEIVKNYARATLERIDRWIGLDSAEINHLGVPPPIGHWFWGSEPDHTQLEIIKKERQRAEKLDTLPEQVTFAINQGLANIEEKIGALNASAKPTSKSISKQPQARTRLKEKLEYRLQTLQMDALYTQFTLDEIDNAFANYVAPEGQLSADSTTRFDLLDKAKAFLASSKKTFLLKGDAGTGKTTFLHYLHDILWKDYNLDKACPVPFFISLADFPPSGESQDFIKEYLLSKKLSESEVEALRKRRCVFMLDGLDEIAKPKQAFHTNSRFSDWPETKLFISSRKDREYLEEGYQSSFQERYQTTALEECELAPISANWIEQYINNYAQHTPLKEGWTAEHYLKEFNALDALSKLKGVINSPLLLLIALEIWPSLTPKEKNDGISLNAFYEKFFQRWSERSKKRLQHIDLTDKERVAYRKLSKNLGERILRMGQEIAVALAQGGEISFVLEESDEARLLFLSLPLAGQRQFIHKSLQEYLLACAIYEQASAKTAQKESLNRSESTEYERLVISQLSLVHEPLTLDFLVAHVHEKSGFKAHLDHLLEASKRKDAPAALQRAAANAITILVRAGIAFNRRNLAEIKIPGADISRGIFDAADLSGADMTGVRAVKTWWRAADLTGANLSEIRFEEWPSIVGNGEAWGVAYSRDEAFLAVGWKKGEIGIYEVATGIKIKSLNGGEGNGYSMDFFTGEGHLVAGGDDSKIGIWDLSKEELIQELEGHTNSINSVNFSFDGNDIVSASNDCTARVWEAVTGKPKYILQHDKEVYCASFSPDGKRIVTGGQDFQVRVWNDQGEQIHCLQGHTQFVESVNFSLDGERIVSGSYDHTVRVWDKKGKLLHTLQNHEYPVTNVRFSVDGDCIVSADASGTVCIWDTKTGDLLNTIRGYYDYSDRTVISANTRFAVLKEDESSMVRLWEISRNSSSMRTIEGHRDSARNVSTSPRSVLAISGGMDGQICIRDIETGKLEATLMRPVIGHLSGIPESILSVCISSDGRYIAASGITGTVGVWETETGKFLSAWEEVEAFPRAMYGVNFSAGRVIAGGEGGEVWVWEAETANHIWTSKEVGHINSVHSSSDGKYIVAGTKDGKVHVWQWQDEKYIYLSSWGASGTDEKQIHSVNFSPDNRFLAAAGEDKIVRIWKVTDQGLQLYHSLEGHNFEVSSTCFSPNNQFIASASRDGTVRIWDVEKGICLMAFQGGQGHLNSVAWQHRKAGEGYGWLVSGLTGVTMLWHSPEIGKKAKAYPVWIDGLSQLNLEGANLKKSEGLTENNKRLIEQRGGINIPKQTQIKPQSSERFQNLPFTKFWSS